NPKNKMQLPALWMIRIIAKLAEVKSHTVDLIIRALEFFQAPFFYLSINGRFYGQETHTTEAKRAD
ncbi:hypothetical protein ACWKSR_13205, partial [Campylobacter fetus subsp. venerealis]